MKHQKRNLKSKTNSLVKLISEIFGNKTQRRSLTRKTNNLMCVFEEYFKC